MKKSIILLCLFIIAIAVSSCEKEFSGQTPHTVLTIKDANGNVISVNPVIDGDIIQVGQHTVEIRSSRRTF